jgi:uncharacterized protein
MKHLLKSSHKDNIIRTMSTHLLETRDEILAAYCFGSFLTDAFEDIDLGLLLLATPEDSVTYELSLESELEKLIPYSFDVRVINEAPISFSQAVVRGRVIVDRDPNRRADFEGRIIKEYFDFAPFRERYLAEVMNAPL